MADTFVYRADPPAKLAGSDIATLVALQVDAGLNVVTPGNPVEGPEIKKGPHEALARLSADLKAAKAASHDAAVKLALPLPDAEGLDPMLLAGLIGNLITEGAAILEFDGRSYANPETDPSNDGFTLMGLQRPEGFRIAIQMGALADWTAERIEEVAAELAADRYVFSITADDDLSKLASVPEEAMVILGLVSADTDDQAILDIIDKAAEIIDQDRLALTATGGFAEGDEANQEKVLRQVTDVSVQFWGFAM